MRSGRHQLLLSLCLAALTFTECEAQQVTGYKEHFLARKLSLECTEDTVYVASILNLGEDGPTVIEVPGGAGPGTVSSDAIIATYQHTSTKLQPT